MAALSSSVRRLAVRARPAAALVRSFAKKAASADAGANPSGLAPSEITKIFLEMDAAAGSSAAVELPIKLTGRSGELVESLYASTLKTKGAFDKAAKELEAVSSIVHGAGLAVSRFFSTNNYSPEETKLVFETLFSTKEELKSFDSIKDADVKDLLVDNESNLENWRAARKALGAAGISAEVKEIFETLASEGRLDLLSKVAEKASLLRAATSKTLDATVASAVALSKEQQAAISKLLPSYAPAGSALNVNFSVDPAVMGGLLISMNNQVIDLSATTRLVEVVATAKQLA